MRHIFAPVVILIIIISLYGCVLPAREAPHPQALAIHYAAWQRTLMPDQSSLEALVPNQTPAPIKAEVKPSPVLVTNHLTKVFLHPGLPEKILEEINIPEDILTDDEHDADLKITLNILNFDRANMHERLWVYALAAPFYTVTDGITFNQLASFWRGDLDGDFTFSQVLITEEIKAAMQEVLGLPDEAVVKTLTMDALNQLALTDKDFLTLLPFEQLAPHWKVLRVDDQAPIDAQFDPENYPLSVMIRVEGDLSKVELTFPPDNYDPQRRTVLMMTGVTALVRATAYQMEVQGDSFPGRDIKQWLTAADLVHISNEVSFAKNCPFPDPVQPDLIFCSSPERIALLEEIGANIIELSGNHLLDYGVSPMTLTLEMYQDLGVNIYAGGWDLADAQTPALITHHGNQLAFLGCNPVGPPNVWATEALPGAAPCGDYQWLLDEVRQLKAEGYLPIVTLQYAEDYTAYPSPKMESDFKLLADAGAMMVSGSQAHTPKTMVFYQDSFLHYGLGNLFFDQMEVYYNDILMPGTREGFIDRLIIYDGRLISVELLTTMLEDYARPRPMTFVERTSLLTRIFREAIDSIQER
jgi:poly-gamma-glutamate synthesis protein (capsule biosynthesis protein)